MKLRVWHRPQVPCKAFCIEVADINEAWKILNVLWDYDQFQYTNRIKPNYCNASGLEYFDEDEQEWLEWHDEENNYEIREYFENLEDAE